MKRFAFLGGSILLTTAIGLPFFLLHKKVRREENDLNIRYDIDEYMAAKGL